MKEIKNPIFSEEDMMTTEGVLKVLKISRVHLYRLIHDGKIPYCKMFKKYYFSRNELMKWLEQKTHDNKQPKVKNKNIVKKEVNLDVKNDIKNDPYNHAVSLRLANRLKIYCDQNNIEYHKNSFYHNGFLFVDFKDVLKIDISKIINYRNFGKHCLAELVELQKIALTL